MTDETSWENDAPRPLPLRAKPPRASLTLNKKTVILLVVLLAFATGVAVIEAFSPKTAAYEKAKEASRSAFPSEAVRRLPADYTAVKRDEVKKLPERKQLTQKPVLEATAPPSQMSQEEKILEEQRIARLKLAASAHSSEVTFAGVQLQQQKSSKVPSEFASSLSLPPEVQGLQGNSRDEDNRQDDKSKFLTSTRSDDPILSSSLRSPRSPYQLMAGTVIPGVLLTGINSDLPGQIIGQVSQNVFDTVSGRHLLIPQGTKVIGEYDSRISYGQERVLIVWIRLIMPNGTSLSLEGMPGVDLTGYAGLYERVNNHYLRLLGGVVFGSVLGAGAQMAYGSNRSVDPTFEELALQGMAQNINQAGQQITRKNLQIQPTLEVSPGQRFNVFVTKDVVLKPYKA